MLEVVENSTGLTGASSSCLICECCVNMPGSVPCQLQSTNDNVVMSFSPCRFSVVFDEAISLAPGKRYVIPEAPHGVFPLGQLIATSLADQCWPGVCGWGRNTWLVGYLLLGRVEPGSTR